MCRHPYFLCALRSFGIRFCDSILRPLCCVLCAGVASFGADGCSLYGAVVSVRRSRNPAMAYTTVGMTTSPATMDIASSSSSRKTPFSDFGSYMTEKNRKLHNQFNAEALTSSFSGSSSGKPVFA